MTGNRLAKLGLLSRNERLELNQVRIGLRGSPGPRGHGVQPELSHLEIPECVTNVRVFRHSGSRGEGLQRVGLVLPALLQLSEQRTEGGPIGFNLTGTPLECIAE